MTEHQRSRILIVDDEEAILETMTFTFEDDYEVLTATDAVSALGLLEKNSPVAAVISDQRMPNMTGVEFLSRVYALYPNTTRIILTGFADMDAIIEAINDGHVYAYITKPWEPGDLKQVVRRAVDHYHLAVENERLVSDLKRANLFIEAVMDQLDTGALALDSTGVVRASNRAAVEYLGIEGDPRGQALPHVLPQECLGAIVQVATQLAQEDGDFEEIDLAVCGRDQRLRVSHYKLVDGIDQEIGSVILLREISHEPLRRRFEDSVQELADAGTDLRPQIEQALEEIGKLADQARGGSVRSAGMAELEERASRTVTALQNWLDVDDTLAREDYPDAQLLMDRLRVAMARWPLPEAVPEPVTQLAKRVEAYYESGENSKQRVL